MQSWEYTVADFTRVAGATSELNRLGAVGWEAVGLVTTWGAGWRLAHPVVLLKRPLVESEPDAARQAAGEPVASAV